MSEELKACPFCGGEAKRITLGDDEPGNAGGDVVCCQRCGASSHVEFGYKENLVDRWNTRTDPDHIAAIRLAREALAVFATAADDIERLYGERPPSQYQFPQLMMRDFTRSRHALAHLDTLLQTKGDDRGEG